MRGSEFIQTGTRLKPDLQRFSGFDVTLAHDVVIHLGPPAVALGIDRDSVRPALITASNGFEILEFVRRRIEADRAFVRRCPNHPLSIDIERAADAGHGRWRIEPLQLFGLRIHLSKTTIRIEPREALVIDDDTVAAHRNTFARTARVEFEVLDRTRLRI